jgi:thiol-disulfide isomerase/thioredoxin
MSFARRTRRLRAAHRGVAALADEQTGRRAGPALRLLAAAALLLAGAVTAQTGDPEPIKAGDPLPALTAFQLEGTLPTNLAGRVVLLDFWASWCGPCRASFPVLDQLHRAYGDRGLVVLGVNVDDTDKAMRKFLGAHPVAFPIVRDGAQKLVAHMGVAGMPTSFLVDRKGVVRKIHSGFHGKETEDALVAEIEELLK